MARREIAMGFAGLALGLSTAFAWLGDRNPVKAQTQGVRVESADFQIAAWALPGLVTHSGGVVREPDYGAYLVDTKRGSVYLINKKDKLVFIGDTTQKVACSFPAK